MGDAARPARIQKAARACRQAADIGLAQTVPQRPCRRKHLYQPALDASTTLSPEVSKALLPMDPAARTECLSWLFWQMGSAPFVGGGFGHFYAYAPFKMEYPVNRHAMETRRQLDVPDRRLAVQPYVAGPHYTIADIAIWSWYGQLALGRQYGAAAP